MDTKLAGACDTLLDRIGRRLAGKLNAESSGYVPYTPSDFETLRRTLRPGDVLLVEGRERISNAIKYLTQSTWSHAAMFAGDALPKRLPMVDPCAVSVGAVQGADLEMWPEDADRPHDLLIEVNLGQGCVLSPLKKYATYNTRICRATGLSDAERAAVVAFMAGKVGLKYDLRNIFDLLRYFFPTPPVPVRWRRRMLAFGSGDPTRAICSSLLAQAFQSVRYPILPDVSVNEAGQGAEYIRQEVYHIRHHSLFAPRDFDLSPFFEVIKPHLTEGFDPHKLIWGPAAAERDVTPAVQQDQS
ncbi:MAG: YiiX/YebB-like N1pC/P60 family cysteine hydrolase [Paracoccaceae bacterium]|nr:YiiX/YebB-like N1pC/P60 family cysteine hydrolase [Paracoccaceae bacterium]